MSTKMKMLVGLTFLGLIDMVIPLPVIGLILIYVLFEKPPWFARTVDEIYDE
jgi:hypothetical protein